MDFYTNLLKMSILRHEEFEEGCEASCNGPYDGKWSKTMVINMLLDYLYINLLQFYLFLRLVTALKTLIL